MTRGFRSPGLPRRGVTAEGLLVMRGRWRDLAELARQTAQVVAAEQPLEPYAESILANQLKRTGAAELPVEGESAARIRAAFLEACRALLLAAAERRLIAARLVVAAAVAVLDTLDLETRRAAAGWQKQFGD